MLASLMTSASVNFTGVRNKEPFERKLEELPKILKGKGLYIQEKDQGGI